MVCDVRTIECPLAFVKAKQALIKDDIKEFLFDDDVSLYNFIAYLDKNEIMYDKNTVRGFVELFILSELS